VHRTTAPPAWDVAALFPGIEQYAATATRLHPRRGVPDPLGSHVGGPLRWPAGEPWPRCDAEHLVATETPVPAAVRARLRAAGRDRNWSGWESAMAELASQIPGFGGVDRRTGSALGYASRSQPVPGALVPLAQLRSADVPDVDSPSGADLLQVLWCPHDHDLDGLSLGPAVTLRWRREEDLAAAPVRLPPAASVGEARYLPHPCVLHPEQVVEYPWWQQLPAELGRLVRDWDAAHDGVYHRQLATAPGWKVGGWPAWPTTDPVPMYCPRCAAPLRQLLQIDGGEWGDPQRWRPVQEQALPSAAAGYLAVTEPTGVIAGRSGLYRVFHCPLCPDLQYRIDLQ